MVAGAGVGKGIDYKGVWMIFWGAGLVVIELFYITMVVLIRLYTFIKIVDNHFLWLQLPSWPFTPKTPKLLLPHRLNSSWTFGSLPLFSLAVSLRGA